MLEHSKEPWVATPQHPDDPHTNAELLDATGNTLLRRWIGGPRAGDDPAGPQIDALIRESQCRWSVAAMSAGDAERTAKCVNAMAGVSDPEKLMTSVRKLVEDNLNATDRTFITINQDGVANIAAALKGDD